MPSFGLAAIHRAEWVDIVSYSWLPKRQIRMHEGFQKALNKRKERASFRPPALIKLIRATSLCTYQCKSRGEGGGGVRARGEDLMPETIPLSGFWSCEATPGSGHLTLTDRSLVSIQKRLPSPALEALWKSLLKKGMKFSFVLITIMRYFKLSSKQIMSILRKVLSSSSHLIVKLDWNRIPPWKSEDFLRVTYPTCSDMLSRCYKAFYVSLIL